MSLSKDNIWKLLAPLVVMGVMLLIPVPDGMPPQALALFCGFRRDDCRYDPGADPGDSDQFYRRNHLRYRQQLPAI